MEVTLGFTAGAHETSLQIDLGLDYDGPSFVGRTPSTNGSGKKLNLRDAKRLVKLLLPGRADAVDSPTYCGQLSSLRVASRTRRP